MVKIEIIVEQIGDSVSFNVVPPPPGDPAITVLELSAGSMVLRGIHATLDTIAEHMGDSRNYTAKDNDILMKIKAKIKEDLNKK